MMFNSEKERKLLSESLKKSGDIPMMIRALDYVIENHSPFSLYIATKDRRDCTWIFDPKIVFYMLGGVENYNAVFDSMFLTEREKEAGIIMFVMRKVGPLVSVRFDEQFINNVLRDLKNSASL